MQSHLYLNYTILLLGFSDLPSFSTVCDVSFVQKTAADDDNQQGNGSVHELYMLMHFFAVLCKTTALIGQIQGFVEKVNTRLLIF